MPTQFLSPERRRIAQGLVQKLGLAAHDIAAIVPSTDSSPAPLSFAQSRLWFHEQLHPGSALYNTPVVVELEGDLDTTALERAFNAVIERHEVLRTVFRVIDGEPRQVVCPASSAPLPVDDLTYLPSGDRRETAMALAEDAVRQPIDLLAGPVFHGRLIKLDARCWWLLALNHHMVFDGWSRSVLLKELAAWYAVHTSQGKPLPALTLQYRDFARWQRSTDMEARLDEQLAWWKRELDGAPTFLALPTDRPRPAVQTFRGNTCAFVIDTDLEGSVRDYARTRGVTSFAIMASALTLLLYRLTGQTDLVVSTGIATRHVKEIEDLIGCFINVLILRTRLSGTETCGELVGRVSRTALNAFAHQDLPFERLVTALAPDRDLSHNPLAQVMIVHHNESLAVAELPGVKMRPVMPEKLIAQYDLLLHLRPAEGDVLGMLEYNVDLFDASTVRRFCEQYVHLLRELVTRPHTAIDEVPLLPKAQAEAILALNGAPAAFPDGQCIHHLIEAQAARQPDAPAIETLDITVSYGELNLRANRLAHRMQQLGVSRGDVVGVSLERSPAMIAALLAVTKCGAAYVPIDPNYPQDRIRFIVADCLTRLVVTESQLRGRFEDRLDGPAFLCLDQEDRRLADLPDDNPTSDAAPDDLLYLIYTSGSTGVPKGVMLDHRGRISNFHDFINRFGIGPGDRVLAISSLSFDMCAFDVFGTLMAGGTIVLASGGTTPQPEEWSVLIRSRNVTIWHSAPALLGVVLERFGQGLIGPAPSLRLALLGGDWIPLTMPDDLRRYTTQQIEVVSLGGATEVSMDSTIYVVGPRDPHWSSIPYGVAMANQSAYVLDDRMRLVPIGVAGELYLGGVGVGWGYFGRAGLTATRFVPNPYARSPGERIYRTGDIARWTSSGSLELLGRADFQVKINGVRIELGEIDAAIMDLDEVKASVTALFRPSDASPRLVSYVVPASDGFDPDHVRNALFDRLPAYMVPHQYVVLEQLPLSPNGKVLRTALPAPELANPAEQEQTEPRTVMERTLYTLWASALGREDFGIDHDFFELGGTSLQAALIVNRMPRRLSLLEFMRNSTIRRQTSVVSSDERPAETRLFRFSAMSQPRLTLLCVPYAGGSAIVFRSLARALPPDIAVAVASLHQSDADDGPPTLERIAEQCLDELTLQELGNLAIYGHCAGTALAAELVRLLERRGHSPKCLFLAAAMPPGVPSPFAMARQTEQEIVDFVAALGGTEESGDAGDWKVMVREFQRDSALVRDHASRNLSRLRNQLNTPLVVIMADDDPLTEGHQAHAEIWRLMCSSARVHEIAGGHYFVSTAPLDVADIIVNSLSSNLARVPNLAS